jgi:hypothetical protein
MSPPIIQMEAVALVIQFKPVTFNQLFLVHAPDPSGLLLLSLILTAL